VTCRSLGERMDLPEGPEGAAAGGGPAPRTDSAFALPTTHLAHPMLIGSSSDDDDDML